MPIPERPGNRDSYGDGAERVPQAGGARHLVQADGTDGARRPGAGDREVPEPLDGLAATKQLGVLREQPGVLGVAGGHAGGVA
jgi:hypothetical protein